MNYTSQKPVNIAIPTELLDDLCRRFIVNVPPEDRRNLVRICFQVELAHWFYIDYYCAPFNLRSCGIRIFAAHVFQHVPELQQHAWNLDAILYYWRAYKRSVPTYGAIILNCELTHVLLVKSYWRWASWGFPKGKINEGEEPWRCAVREVQEETGFDISGRINKNDYLENRTHERFSRLYIIRNVPLNTRFQPQTRYEIEACQWFRLDSLPINKIDTTPSEKLNLSPNEFYLVFPFVKRIRKSVANRNRPVKSRPRHKSLGNLETSGNRNKNYSISQGCQNQIKNNQFQHIGMFSKQNRRWSHTGASYTYGSAPKTNDVYTNNGNRWNSTTNRQLFPPQNTQGNTFSSVQKEESPESDGRQEFRFVAPSWANFRFDYSAIYDCFTTD